MPKQITGIGVGLRRSYAADLARTTRQVDFIEIMPENWVCFGGRRRRQLDACIERFPSVTHSVSLNIGGLDALDDELLTTTAELLSRTNAPFFSDHVCYSSVRGQPVSDLLPLPFTHEVLAHTVRRVGEAQDRVGRPLALENATFYSHMPGAEMDEATFLYELITSADCGMLLDINNVYVNSQNHGFDARAFIDRLPLSRVWQLHLAGHTLINGTLIDTHIGPVIPPVWDLYRYTLRRAGRLIPTLIEWDQDIPPLDAVLDELDRARLAADQALGEVTP